MLRLGFGAAVADESGMLVVDDGRDRIRLLLVVQAAVPFGFFLVDVDVVVEEQREKNDMSLQARRGRCRMRRAGKCFAEESILILGLGCYALALRVSGAEEAGRWLDKMVENGALSTQPISGDNLKNEHDTLQRGRFASLQSFKCVLASS